MQLWEEYPISVHQMVVYNVSCSARHQFLPSRLVLHLMLNSVPTIPHAQKHGYLVNPDCYLNKKFTIFRSPQINHSADHNESPPAHISLLYTFLSVSFSERGIQRKTGCHCAAEHISAITCCCQWTVSSPGWYCGTPRLSKSSAISTVHQVLFKKKNRDTLDVCCIRRGCEHCQRFFSFNLDSHSLTVNFDKLRSQTRSFSSFW